MGGNDSVETLFQRAKEQAALYASGSLAGFELAGCRYLVVVSEDRVNVPEDVETDGVLHRHINIAVDPSTPSRGVQSRR